MKRNLSFLLMSILIFGCVISAGFGTAVFAITDAAGLWAKYTAPDGSYSFHYPQGWKVTAAESTVVIENSQTDEQLLLAGVPFDPRKSPADLAAGFINLLKGSNPNTRASNWQVDPNAGGSRVLFDLSDENNGKQYKGLGIVIKVEQHATWFSYIAPATGYSRAHGFSLLQGFSGSLASGSASQAPTIDYNIKVADNMDRNAQAFMFVLEFALGAPLTKAQEDVIIAELKNGWRSLPEAELQKYDQYPIQVQTILKLGQKDLEKLRAGLESSIQEWLDGTDQSDRAVIIIRDQLQNRGRIIIAGDPPLTEMSLTAYSEIITYSRLLGQNPQAMPEQITPNSVKEIEKQVLKVWRSFSTTDRQDIATTPGLWICLRMLLRNGTKTEQEKIRTQLRQLDAVTRNTRSNTNQNPNNNIDSGNKQPMDTTTHWCLMQMQQMTFNTYMWSRGFNYSPATGKMW